LQARLQTEFYKPRLIKVRRLSLGVLFLQSLRSNKQLAPRFKNKTSSPPSDEQILKMDMIVDVVLTEAVIAVTT